MFDSVKIYIYIHMYTVYIYKYIQILGLAPPFTVTVVKCSHLFPPVTVPEKTVIARKNRHKFSSPVLHYHKLPAPRAQLNPSDTFPSN